MIEAAKLENLIGDRAYGSDELDGELREEGVEMIAPPTSLDSCSLAASASCLGNFEMGSHPKR